MKKVCVITSTRAEFGLLSPIIRKLKNDPDLTLDLIVTGTHLSKEFGMTKEEILNSGISITKEINIMSHDNSDDSVSNIMARTIVLFSEYFKNNRPDIAVVLGDRYETLAVCIALTNERIPIAHLCGGETTQGAIDECYRHSISKMSYIHFVTNSEHRKRVIQLGEDPDRVYLTGSTAIENIKNLNFISMEEIENSLNLKLSNKPYAIITFHPVTLEENTGCEQCKEIFIALDHFQNMNFIFTKSNADNGGSKINKLIDEYVKEKSNIISVASLGMVRYFSLLKNASMVIGNSSSGIIEAPSFKIPTVNIGDRQKGRMQASSIINAEPENQSIINAIKIALSPEFKGKCQNTINPYGDGDASEKIIAILKDSLMHNNINLKKSFYDVDFEVK